MAELKPSFRSSRSPHPPPKCQACASRCEVLPPARPSEACASLLHRTRVPGRSRTADRRSMHVTACGREQEARSWSTASRDLPLADQLREDQAVLLREALQRRSCVIPPGCGFPGRPLRCEFQILPPRPPLGSLPPGGGGQLCLSSPSQTLNPGAQGSCCSFPTWALAPVPTHSKVSELSRQSSLLPRAAQSPSAPGAAGDTLVKYSTSGQRQSETRARPGPSFHAGIWGPQPRGETKDPELRNTTDVSVYLALYLFILEARFSLQGNLVLKQS